MSHISKKVILLAFTAAVAATSQAQDLTVRACVCAVNPAASMYRAASGASRAYVHVGDASYGDASLTQTGTGEYMLTIGAESWMPLDTLQTVWGDASYTAGHRRNVRWANAVDIDRVAPYIIGDEVGGNLSTQIYDFGGGYARRLGRRLTLGLSLGYRAEIDYRQRDPRLRAIVSDLDIAAGAAYNIGHRMLLTVGAALNLYNQDDDVDFYAVDNSVRVYPLTGLGTTYSRFSGLTGDYSTAYKATGWGANIALIPEDADADRPTIAATVTGDNLALILRGYNNLKLTQLQHRVYTIGASRPVTIDRVKLVPSLSASYRKASGTENLFGSAVGNIYEQIGSRQPYSNESLSATVSVTARWSVTAQALVAITPSFAFFTDSEKMTTSDRQLAYRTLTPAVDLSWSQQWTSLWSTSLNAGMDYRLASSTTYRLTGLDLDNSIAQMIVNDFAYLTSDAVACKAAATIERKLTNRISLNLNVGMTYAKVSDHHNRRLIYSSLSVNF